MADESGGFTGHLIAPKEPKASIDDQHIDSFSELGEKPSTQASPASNSESAGKVLSPTRLGESAKPNVTPDFEKFQFSKTLGK